MTEYNIPYFVNIASQFFDNLIPNCVRNFEIPSPPLISGEEHKMFEPQYYPYIIKMLTESIGHSISIFCDGFVDCAYIMGYCLRDGYHATITREKINKVRTISALIDVIRITIAYDKFYVCDATLNSLISQLETLDQETCKLVSCSLEYYYDYRSRGKSSERDSVLTLKVVISNSNNPDQLIILEEPCYGWLIKSVNTIDHNGNRVVLFVCNGNYYK